MSEITAKLEGEGKKQNLVITIPFNAKGTPSKSGKTMVVATTSGNKPVEVKGFDKELVAGINVYFKPE